MQCERCRELIPEGEERQRYGQILCEDCYMDLLSPLKGCDPWAVHSAKTFAKEAGSVLQLNAIQQKILDTLSANGPMEPNRLSETLHLTHAVPYDDAKPGAAVSVQSFGDFQNFNPHLHVLATDGCFYNDAAFMVCPPPDTSELEKLFRYEVFKMLKAEGKITDVIIEDMKNWRHSGFNVYCGNAIWPHNQEGLENLARYIIRASFSQERMTYVAVQDTSDRIAKVIYQSKDAKTVKTFDAMDWLAQLVTHIPNKGEQMVRYYGFYSNKSRGLRKKAGTDDQVPALIESEISSKEFRKNWARLIQKIYPAAAGLIHWFVLSVSNL